jgi:hypothetical protein
VSIATRSPLPIMRSFTITNSLLLRILNYASLV